MHKRAQNKKITFKLPISFPSLEKHIFSHHKKLVEHYIASLCRSLCVIYIIQIIHFVLSHQDANAQLYANNCVENRISNS